MRQSSSHMEGGHPYLNGSPKAIFFTDFDGTVTLQDCKLYIHTHAFHIFMFHEAITKKLVRQ
jgi:hypothetical protein